MSDNSVPIILALVIGVLIWYVVSSIVRPSDRATRPRPTPPRRPQRTEHAAQVASTPARRPAAPTVPAPRQALVQPTTPAPPQPIPPPATPYPTQPLDPNDPLVQRYHAVAAHVQSTFASIDALPATLDDRVTMRATVMVAELTLKELGASLPASNPGLRTSVSDKLDKLARQLTSMRASAENVAASYASLAKLLGTLPGSAASLRQQIDTLRSEADYPVVLSRSGPISAAAIGLIERFPPIAAVRSHDDLKRQLLRARGLLNDIAAGHQAVAIARAQRAQIMNLLASPELAAQPEWHRAIVLLAQRTPGDAPIAALAADADVLLERRRALVANLPLDDAGRYRLDEERLPQLVDAAATIQREVHLLWQRARSLAAARRQSSHASG